MSYNNTSLLEYLVNRCEELKIETKTKRALAFKVALEAVKKANTLLWAKIKRTKYTLAC